VVSARMRSASAVAVGLPAVSSTCASRASRRAAPGSAAGFSWPLAGLQAEVARDGVRAAGGVELAQDARDVGLDRVGGDDELASDGLVGGAGGQQFEHFALAGREERVAARGGRVGGAARIEGECVQGEVGAGAGV
jgi:hypothetical protein